MDWRPWGPEAFAEAKRENKPVFLSIGFSTCLWCEVMRRESFQNPGIAALLNESFVPVLVDREERPDVDRTYMAAARAAGWGAGWPLNLWLTPDRKPFFGGAYFPPETKGGLTGLKELLPRVAESWRARREDAVRDAEDAARALEEYVRPGKAGPPPGPAALDAAFEAYRGAYDARSGAFGPPPLFPPAWDIRFLLRYAARTGKTEAREMAVRVLRAMAAGALHDRAGGGFHRYAGGAGWSAPHLEKTLAGNARLAIAYLEGYRATRGEDLALAARDTLDYLLRGLARPGGGFYTAERPESRDENILAGDNGAALEALAMGARVLKEPRYLAAASATARFVRENLYDEKANRLYRRWRDGERKIPAFAEDYAGVVAGLLELQRAAPDPATLAWAARLSEAPPSPPDASLIASPEDADAEAIRALNEIGMKRSRAAGEILGRFASGIARAPREHAALLCALEAALPQPASGKVK